MEALFRILIIAAFLGIIFYYAGPNAKQYKPLEGPSTVQQPIIENNPQMELSDSLSRPTEGLSTFIGKKSENILAAYGRPTRIDLTPYGYKWWVYKDDNRLKMFAVEDGHVVQVYTNGTTYNTSPYKIGQAIEDIYRMTIIESEVTAEIDDNIYIFAMNDYDLHSRILVKFDTVFAQLYLDIDNEKLLAIRFLDAKTLAKHKPYEMQFIGEMIQSDIPPSYYQRYIHKANAAQLVDFTNSWRQQQNLPQLVNEDVLNDLAAANSEALFLQSLSTQQNVEQTSLKERLALAQMEFKHASEITATSYIDAIEVMHGWLNSKEHRKALMDEKLSHIGTGVYMDYYTEILLTKNSRAISSTQ